MGSSCIADHLRQILGICVVSILPFVLRVYYLEVGPLRSKNINRRSLNRLLYHNIAVLLSGESNMPSYLRWKANTHSFSLENSAKITSARKKVKTLILVI